MTTCRSRPAAGRAPQTIYEAADAVLRDERTSRLEREEECRLYRATLQAVADRPYTEDEMRDVAAKALGLTRPSPHHTWPWPPDDLSDATIALELLAAGDVTPGPWAVDHIVTDDLEGYYLCDGLGGGEADDDTCDNTCVAYYQSDGPRFTEEECPLDVVRDLSFLARARTAYPAALREVLRLRQVVRAAGLPGADPVAVGR